jgi:hypothetical protein
MRPPARVVWRELTVGLVLPERAFGAAVDVDGLLVEPDLHFTAAPTTSRLMLMPQAGAFSRLLLEWETLPEIGVFTAGTLGPSVFTAGQVARLETWMRDVAVVLHANRDRIRESAERAVRDASAGLATSLPGRLPEHAHVVSATVGTRVTGPAEGARFGVVDVVPAAEPGAGTLFVERGSGRLLGRRSGAGELDPARGTGVGDDDLAGWYDQHIFREVLFDDVWQVHVHLVAGLEPPANVTYLAG